MQQCCVLYFIFATMMHLAIHRRLVLFVFLIGSVIGYAQEIQGTIKDENSKAAIPFCPVQLVDLGISTLSDSIGNFSFKGKFPKSVRIQAASYGYDSKIEEVQFVSEVLRVEILLVPRHIEVEGVIVEAQRGIIQKEITAPVEHKSISELNEIRSTNLGEAISQIPGVQIISTGTGISKPVIRGLSGSRVLTYLNSQRLENQQWGGDHGMGLTELGIGSVEVIKGPATLLYGADALGGVLYFIDESFSKQGSTEVNVRSQFESVSLGTSNQLAIKQSNSKIRWNLYGGINSFADYQLPNGLYAKNSRYSDKLGKITVGFGRGNWVSSIRANFIQSVLGIPGHTHDTVITPALFQSKKSERAAEIPQQNNINTTLSWENKWFVGKNEYHATVGHHYNQLTEFEEKVTIPGIDMQLNTSSYNLRYKRKMNVKNSFQIGLQGLHQLNKNSTKAEERLIPNARTIDNGVFALYNSIYRRFTSQVGVRYDVRSIATVNDTVSFGGVYQSFTFSGGTVYSTKKTVVRFNISSGFRAPHTSELLANGVHHGTLRYEVGNSNLKNEQAIQFDLATEFTGEHLAIVVNPFYNQLFNFIYINPTNGIKEGLPVYQYEQSKNAQLYGGDLGIHYHPHFAHWLHLEHTVSFVEGKINSSEYLPLIPQTKFNTQVKFAFKNRSKFHLENIVIQHSYYEAQRHVAVYETTSKGFHLVNIGLNFKNEVRLPFELSLGVKNATNTAAINHLSRLKTIGLPQPGINGYVSILFSFTRKNK